MTDNYGSISSKKKELKNVEDLVLKHGVVELKSFKVKQKTNNLILKFRSKKDFSSLLNESLYQYRKISRTPKDFSYLEGYPHFSHTKLVEVIHALQKNIEELQRSLRVDVKKLKNLKRLWDLYMPSKDPLKELESICEILEESYILLAPLMTIL